MFDSVSLPSGYEQIEYIATSTSDGFGSYRYINPDIWIDAKNYNKLKIVSDSLFTSSEYYGGNGIRESGGQNRCIYFGIHQGKLVYGTGVGEVVATTNYDWKRHIWIYDTKNGIFSVDGLYNKTFSVIAGMSAWGDFYIGATYEIPGINTAAQNIYRFQIYIDDVLVRDLIPCQEESSGIIGMYDVVNDKFYTNAGSGSLPFPLPVTEVSTQHRTFADSTKYNICKGIANVNGEDRIIDKGIIRIGDTGYTIPFSYRVTIHGGTLEDLHSGFVLINGVAYSNNYGASNYKFELELEYGTVIEVFDWNAIDVNGTIISDRIYNHPWHITNVSYYKFELTSDVDIDLDGAKYENVLLTKVTTFNLATEHSSYIVTVPSMVFPNVAQSSMDGTDMPIFERREWFEKGSIITFNCFTGTILMNGVDVGSTYSHIINHNLYISYDDTNLILTDDTMPMYHVTVLNDIGNIAYIGYDPAFYSAWELGKYPFSLRYPEGTILRIQTNHGTITIDGNVIPKPSEDTLNSLYIHTLTSNLVVSPTHYEVTSGKWTYECTDLNITSVPSLTLDPIFAFNSWENIILACQSGVIPSTWAIGDSKVMTIGDTDYAITIIGKNHDTYVTGGIAPITFEMLECYKEYKPMNSTDTNVGGWRDCDMRNTHLPALKALMPEGVQSAIRKVLKSSSEGNKSKTLITTEDDLFILAEREVFTDSKSWVSVKGEGTQYEYYAVGNDVVKRKSGTRQPRFTRSPYTGSTTNFACVHANGFTTSVGASASTYVAFAVAFCF